MARRLHGTFTDGSKDTAADYTQRGVCPSGKRGWPSKKMAKQDAKYHNRHGQKFYRCLECSQVHATKMSYMEQVEAGLIPADR